jgi:hypothetical protein
MNILPHPAAKTPPTTSILVYRVPPNALKSVGIIRGTEDDRGYLPEGDYIQHVVLGMRGCTLCLVPATITAKHDNPHYWVNEHDADRFSSPYIPMDHNPPEPGKLYFGLNFTEAQWPVIQDAMERLVDQGAASFEEAIYDMAEHLLSSEEIIRLPQAGDEPPRAA